MSERAFPWRKTFILGFGFFGISIIWPLFNSLVPPFLEDLGLTTIVIGFILTWDNIIKMIWTVCVRQSVQLLSKSVLSSQKPPSPSEYPAKKLSVQMMGFH